MGLVLMPTRSTAFFFHPHVQPLCVLFLAALTPSPTPGTTLGSISDKSSKNINYKYKHCFISKQNVPPQRVVGMFIWSSKVPNMPSKCKRMKLCCWTSRQWVHLRAVASNTSILLLHEAGNLGLLKSATEVLSEWVALLHGHTHAPSWNLALGGGLAINLQHEFTGPLIA